MPLPQPRIFVVRQEIRIRPRAQLIQIEPLPLRLPADALVAEPARCGEMNLPEIERFLPRTTDGNTTMDKPALAACGATQAPETTEASKAATCRPRAP